MRMEFVLTHVDPLSRHDHSATVCGKQTQYVGTQHARTFASLPVKELWRSVGAVCFDVDSTVCEDEGIDVLAEHCGAGAAVKEWTHKYVVSIVMMMLLLAGWTVLMLMPFVCVGNRAMNGNVKFEDALAARLDIIKPSKDDIKNCLKARPPQLTTGTTAVM